METEMNKLICADKEVLIVPCGMETIVLENITDEYACINCTLRNGNKVKKQYDKFEEEY